MGKKSKQKKQTHNPHSVGQKLEKPENTKNKKLSFDKIIFAAFVIVFFIICMVKTPISGAVGSLWSLLPPIVAI